jgi:DNA-directed RNA polymerase specialized sigma24 family protein
MKDNNTNEVTTLGEIINEARRIAINEARRRGLSHADAEDTAQTITLRLWMSIKEGKQVKSVEAWVRRTTANYIIDSHRRSCRIKNGPGLLETLVDIDESRIRRD